LEGCGRDLTKLLAQNLREETEDTDEEHQLGYPVYRLRFEPSFFQIQAWSVTSIPKISVTAMLEHLSYIS
jgi:hypothetical protein